MNRKEFEDYLNKSSKKILEKIEECYSVFLSVEQKNKLAEYKNKNFIVVQESSIYRNKKPEYPIDKKVPFAHSTKSFNDGLVHFYPEEHIERFNEQEMNIYEVSVGVLIHEIFHIFIQPVSTNLDTKLKIAIEEGMIDFMTRDFCGKCGINYNSGYEKHASFIYDALGKVLKDDNEIMKNIFSIKEEELTNLLLKNNINIESLLNEHLDSKSKKI